MKVLTVLLCLGLALPVSAQTLPEEAAPAHTGHSSPVQAPDTPVFNPEKLLAYLARNPEWLAAQEQVQAAQARLKLSEARLWPQLSLNSQLTASNVQRMSLPVPGVDPMNMSMRPSGASANLNLTALYPVYTGGQIQAEVELARIALRNADLQLQQQKLQLWKEARQNLLELAWNHSQQAVLRRFFNWHDEMHQLSEEQFRLGKIPRYLLLRSQSDLQGLEMELNQLQERRIQLNLELQRILPGADSLPETGLALPQKIPPAPEAEVLVSWVFEHAPELAMRATRLKEAETRVSLAQASYFPFVYLAAVYEQRIPENPAMQMTSGGALDLLIALPVFDGFKRDAQVQNYQAEARQRLAEYTDLQNRLRAQALQLRQKLITQTENLQLAGKMLANLQEEVDISRLRLAHGKGILLETLDALARFQAGQLKQLEAWYFYQQARIELDSLLNQIEDFE